MVIWHIFPILVCCTKKNLATLVSCGVANSRFAKNPETPKLTSKPRNFFKISCVIVHFKGSIFNNTLFSATFLSKHWLQNLPLATPVSWRFPDPGPCCFFARSGKKIIWRSQFEARAETFFSPRKSSIAEKRCSGKIILAIFFREPEL
jgi:hypothetical protein